MLVAADAYLITALAIGFAVRTYLFNDIPGGLNQDEASTGYDAFSILRYGTDRHGFWLPMMLVGWGSGTYGLPAYVLTPFIALFGLSTFAIRLPFLLAGMTSIALIYEFLRKIRDKKTARIGALLMAIMPWPIMASRWALDANLLPFFFIIAAVAIAHSFERPRLLPIATAAFALTLYAYGTAYIIAPLTLIATLWYGVHYKKWTVKNALLSFALFCALAVPMLLYLLINTFDWNAIELPFMTIPKLTGIPRFQTMSGVGNSETFFAHALKNSIKAINLFFTQRDGLLWNALPSNGMVYIFGMPLAISGFLIAAIGLVRKKIFDPSFILFTWCIACLFLIPLFDLNINRANIAIPAAICCIAIACAFISHEKPAAWIVGIIFAGSFAFFVRAYFVLYPAAASDQFQESFGEAIIFAAHQTDGVICVTDKMEMSYIYVLFYLQENPRMFYDTAKIDNPGAEFQHVVSMGRYRFGLKSCTSSADVIIAARNDKEKEASTINHEEFTTKEFERFIVFKRK